MIKTCNKCDISSTRNSIVNGFGNINKQGIMIIGEAPGYYEDKYGIPFVGNSGKFLNRILDLVGINRTDVYTTNIIKCKPPKNRQPLAVEISNCKLNLINEIQILKPVIIILLGNTALNSYFNKTTLRVSKVRGYYIKQQTNVVITTYHPSYILRNSDNVGLLNLYLKDFILIGKLYRLLINPLTTFKF